MPLFTYICIETRLSRIVVFRKLVVGPCCIKISRYSVVSFMQWIRRSIYLRASSNCMTSQLQMCNQSPFHTPSADSSRKP